MAFFEKEQHTVIVAKTDDNKYFDVKYINNFGDTTQYKYLQSEAEELTLDNARTHDQISGMFLGGLAASFIAAITEILQDGEKITNPNQSLFIPTIIVGGLCYIISKIADSKANNYHRLNRTINEAQLLNIKYYERIFTN